MNDTYGSELRERTKRSMELPAGEKEHMDKFEGFVAVVCGAIVYIVAMIVSLQIIIHAWRYFNG